ncbi:MAG: nucleotide exchange factor GrpE [Clostridia bacterium]|nr:nucleotide exchange factor GrpE [Clostridia bacterium]
MTEEQKKEELKEEKTEQQTEETPEENTSEPENTEEKKEEKTEEKPAEKKEEDEDLNTRYMRLMADFQNFRRRTEKEKSDIYAYGNEKLVSDMLPILDNFERALAAAPEGDKFTEGMELIYKQMVDALKKNKVEEIEAEGKVFDPNMHNAVMRQAKEGAESDTVITVLQKGYTLNGKVVRPSTVIVAE